MLHPQQSRAARGLVNWSQAELARRAGISPSTVRDFETGRRTPLPLSLAAMDDAFRAAGIEFVNGTQLGVLLALPGGEVSAGPVRRDRP